MSNSKQEEEAAREALLLSNCEKSLICHTAHMVTHCLDLYRFLILLTLITIQPDQLKHYRRLNSIERKCKVQGELEVYFHIKYRVIVICSKGSDWVNKTTARVIYELTYFQIPDDWGTVLHVKDGAPGTRDPSFKLMAEMSGRKEFTIGADTSSVVQPNDLLPNHFLQ